MNENISIINNSIPLDFCNEAISLIKNGKPATIGLNGHVCEETRRSSVVFLDSMMENWNFFHPIIDIVCHVNDTNYKFTIYHPENIQISRYDSSNEGHFALHTDCLPESNDPTFVQRKLSLVIQLSPPESYTGGELIFPDIKDYNPNVAKGQGTAIVFPSYLRHAVTPVTEGVRHSLTSWFLGPPFK